MLSTVVLAAAMPLSAQTITTFAGNGTATYNGDNQPALKASLNSPKGIAAGPDGTVYIADQKNFRVRAVNPKTLAISTLVGNGVNGYSGDGGPAVGASISQVLAVALDGNGNLYFSDGSNNRRIRRISPGGVVTTIAGNGIEGSSGDGGPAVNAQVGVPTALVIDAKGNLYFTDTTPSCQCVRKIDTNGIITRVAGNGVTGYAGDNGPALQASLNFPLGITVDVSGNVYVADAGNNAVRKIVNGRIVPVAGNGAAGFSGDGGQAVSATLNLPSDVASDVSGNLYIADAGNNRVRRIDSGGNITTIAGTGANTYSGDGGVATAATLNHPWGLAADANGTLYIADDLNNCIRVIAAANLGPPVLGPNSAVNAASFAPGAPVAPGSYVAVFGSNFSSATISAQSVPLPTTLGNTSVTVNGVQVPLYFVSPTQINIQMPFNVANGAQTIQVNRGATASAQQLVGVQTYSPAIFMYGASTTQGIVLHSADFSLVTPSSPAKPGEYIVVYADALGPLTVPQQAGQAAPSAQPLALTATNPTVTLGSSVMSLSYSGLAPTLVGIYQINFQIPTSMQAGNYTMTINSNGVLSNTAVVPVQ
jgi:uncharacterized protein (TIGR03437 family)